MIKRGLSWCVASLLVVSACGDDPAPSPTGGSAKIGAAGGTVESGGAKVVVPPGALSQEVEITIREVGRDGNAIGYQLGPEGLTFAKPVEITLPVSAGTEPPRIYWSAAGDLTTLEELSGTLVGDKLTASVSHFSLACTERCAAVSTSGAECRCWSGKAFTTPICVICMPAHGGCGYLNNPGCASADGGVPDGGGGGTDAGGTDGGGPTNCINTLGLSNPDFETPVLTGGGSMATSTTGPFNGWTFEGCGDPARQISIIHPAGAPLPPPASGNQHMLFGNNCFINQSIPNPAPGNYRLTIAYSGPIQGELGSKFFQSPVAGGAQVGTWRKIQVETTVAPGAPSLKVRFGNGGAPSWADNVCLEKLP